MLGNAFYALKPFPSALGKCFLIQESLLSILGNVIWAVKMFPSMLGNDFEAEERFPSMLGNDFRGVYPFPRGKVLELGVDLPKPPKRKGPLTRHRVQMCLSGKGTAIDQHQPTKGVGMKLTVALARTKLDEEIGYGYALISAAESLALPELLSSKPYLRLAEAYEKLSNGHYKHRKNTYTEELRELDGRRDRSYRSLVLAIQSAACSGFAEDEAAAKPLMELTKHFGSSFIRGSKGGESAMLTKLLENLKSPRCSMAVSQLRLGRKVAQIEELELEFDHCQSLSDGDRGAKMHILSASNVRHDFEEAVRVFMVYLQAKLMEEDDERWSKLCGRVSTLNKELATREALRAAARKRKKKNEDIQP